MPRLLISFASAHEGISPPLLDGNTRPDPVLCPRASANTSTARPERGTLCWRPAFIRSPGIVHKPVSRSISSHTAPLTSPERTAVTTANSAASRSGVCAFACWIRTMAYATSRCGSARRCFLAPSCLGNAAVTASPAGLSWRCPWAMAHFMTAAIRWRTRLAVSGRLFQIGDRQSMTSADVISSTLIEPIAGRT